jgi:hypothetical protein
LLDRVWIAHFLISGFSLKFKDLHEYDQFVTGPTLLRANGGAAVDVRGRMNAGSADE